MDQYLENIRNAIERKPHYCHGTVPLEGETPLFYKVDKNAKSGRYIDLAQASAEDAELLNDACQPATFGRGQEDVLDENYRKAGKMDSSDFSTSFHLQDLRIIDRIREQLLDAGQQKKHVKAELYKLNVYGQGSFFKSHKDTPRSETMFGSLVIVFPTAHVGGGLVLRHNDTEWTFDSSALVQGHETPSIAYVAFFSDVDHEVLPVESGYRITLTYNLYLQDALHLQNLTPLLDVRPVVPPEGILKAAISSALSDPAFLPSGGHLGFGLSFMYPLKTEDSASTKISDLRTIRGMLKGSDSLIMSVCCDLGLDPKLKGVYIDNSFRWDPDHGVPILVDQMIPSFRDEYQYEKSDILREEGVNSKYLLKPGEKPHQSYIRMEQCMEVNWVTPSTDHSAVKVKYTAYGNETMMAHMYINVCIIVSVGPPGERKTPADQKSTTLD